VALLRHRQVAMGDFAAAEWLSISSGRGWAQEAGAGR